MSKFSCWAKTSTVIAIRRPPVWDFCALAARHGRSGWHPACALHNLASARFRQGNYRRHRRQPVLCNHVHLPVQSGSSEVLARIAAPLHPRRIHAPHRLDEKARRSISITTDIIVGFPGETEADLDQTLALLDEVEYDSCLALSTRAARTPPRSISAATSARRKRFDAWPSSRKKQRAIQIRRNSELVGKIEEAFVEGYNQATAQWIGRTTQNRTLNFVHPQFASPREAPLWPALPGTFASPARVRIL